MKWLAALLLPLLATFAQAQPTLQNDLGLNYLEQLAPHPAAEPLVIFLHGYGANEDDLFVLRERLPASYSYLSVQAPMPLGEGRYQWFSKTPVDGPYDGVEEEVGRSLSRLRTFVARAGDKYQVAPNRIYLVGFSQGAMMSYELALRYPQSVAGIAALSGKLTAGLQASLPSLKGFDSLAVFIGHGTADPVLTYQEATDARNALLKAGVNADFHAYPGVGHSISVTQIQDLAKWLKGAANGAAR
jgi:phospholipase/carboxylesterase